MLSRSGKDQTTPLKTVEVPYKKKDSLKQTYFFYFGFEMKQTWRR